MLVTTNVYSKSNVPPWEWYNNNPTFAKEFNKLVKKHPVKKEWLRKLNGVGSPVKNISLDGVKYEYGYSCKPHDCADNQIHVLYNPQKKQIYAIYGLNEIGRFLDINYPKTIKEKLIELSRLKLKTKNEQTQLVVDCIDKYNEKLANEAFYILKKGKGSLRKFMQEGFDREEDEIRKISEKGTQEGIFKHLQMAVIIPSIDKFLKTSEIKTENSELIKEILVIVQTNLLTNKKLRTEHGTKNEIKRVVKSKAIRHLTKNTSECASNQDLLKPKIPINSKALLIGKWNEYDTDSAPKKLQFFKNGSSTLTTKNQKITGSWKISNEGKITAIYKVFFRELKAKISFNSTMLEFEASDSKRPGKSETLYFKK